MKISRDTFIACARACLGGLPQDEPQPLWAWLAKLEGLLARPPLEPSDRRMSDEKRWPVGTVLIGIVDGWPFAIRMIYQGTSDVMGTYVADCFGGRWGKHDPADQPWILEDRPWSIVEYAMRPATSGELAAIEAIEP